MECSVRISLRGDVLNVILESSLGVFHPGPLLLQNLRVCTSYVTLRDLSTEQLLAINLSER